MITQHFIENNIKNIEMINSSNKLNQILGGGKKCVIVKEKASIKYTLNDLNENTEISRWFDHFNKHSKKDDRLLFTRQMVYLYAKTK